MVSGTTSRISKTFFAAKIAKMCKFNIFTLVLYKVLLYLSTGSSGQ